jgi:curved DNA-binding protein CbpA
VEFINYYELLEITPGATVEEITIAFKREAIKWHPDKNTGIDTTERMQGINEARLILTDTEARSRYDAEFARHFGESAETNAGESKGTARTIIIDEELARWMENARRQSVDLARQTIKDFAGMSKVAVKEGGKAFGQHMLAYLVSGIFLTLFFAILRGCH